MKKIYITASLLILFISRNALANMSPGGFNYFPNYYFIETGTFEGDSIAKILKTGLFAEIYSMDIDPIRIQDASHRFQTYPNVHIIQGDTAQDLQKILRKIDQVATFWLDAHTGSSVFSEEKNTPLLEELEQIRSHPIKTHTILIDDMHCCGTALFDFITKEQIIEKIQEINPDYKISYMSGGDHGEYPNNIMVARIDPENIDGYLQERLSKEGLEYTTLAAALKLLSERNMQTIVKTGTEEYGNQGSTAVLSHWAYDHHAGVFSIDTNKERLSQIQESCALYSNNVSFILEDPVCYLINFPKQIDFLYLNNSSLFKSNPSSADKQTLDELIAAYDKLTKKSVIMIDNYNNQEAMKENLVVKYLLKRGWYLHTNRRQAIFCKSNPYKRI